MSTIIATVPGPSATYGAGQRKVDRTSNGVLWTVYASTYSTATTTPLSLAYSANNGTSWTVSGTIANGSGGATASYTPDAGLFIDADDYLHIVYKDQYSGGCYYRRGTPNAGRTSYALSAAVLLFNGTMFDYPDVVAFRDPAGSGGWVAHAVCTANNQQVAYAKVTITSAAAITAATSTMMSAATGAMSATIDFQHTGDGKSPVAAPALFVGWTAQQTGAAYGIRFAKVTYSAGAWTWGTERAIDTSGYVDSQNYRWLNCLFDGTRVLLVGWVLSGSSYNLVLHDRDTADTTTTTRTLIVGSTAGAATLLSSGSAAYDAAGNVYIAGRGGSSTDGAADLSWVKWTRSSNTISARTQIDSTGLQAPYLSLRRNVFTSTGASRLDMVYTDPASPYALMYANAVLNVAPNAPSGLTPAAGSVDRAVTQRLAWTFSDPDVGDHQSKADVQWRTNNAGATGAWQPATVTTPNTWWDAPPATFPAGGIEWQVRTYDAQGVIGPWSSSAFFTAGTAPAAPTITAPISGATIPTSTVTVTFSEPNLDSFDWRVLGDNAGVADPGVVLNAGTTVTDPTARTFTAVDLSNGVTVHLQVRVSYQGLKSVWADSRNPVSYTPPPIPTVTLTGDDATGSLLITASNPAPSGTQPAVNANEVWIDDGAGLQRRKTDLAPSGTWAYPLPVSGRDYTGRVRLVAVAVNGTTATSS